MKGRQVPPLADDRRIRACLKACEHISTEELEAGLVRRSAPISGRIEASGFAEAMNRAWERKHGQSLDAQPDSLLMPLKRRRRA